MASTRPHGTRQAAKAARHASALPASDVATSTPAAVEPERIGVGDSLKPVAESVADPCREGDLGQQEDEQAEARDRQRERSDVTDAQR